MHWTFSNHEEVDEFYKKNLRERIESSNYFKMLSHALSLEDQAFQREFESVELSDVQLNSEGDCLWFRFDSSLFDVISENFELTLKLTPISIQVGNPIIVEAFKVESEKIFLKKKRYIKINVLYNVKLLTNRINFRAAHKALENLKEYDLESFFSTFTSLPKFQQKRHLKVPIQIVPVNSKIQQNAKQMIAVWKIIHRSTFPRPLVVCGPPGAGKTTVIVEAATQIVAFNSDARILITGHSNYVCDKIALRFLKYLPRPKICRYYPKSVESQREKIHSDLLGISNMNDLNREILSEEEFHSFNVFITTCVSAQDFAFSSQKKTFDYVFVVEADAGTEVESLIPIVAFSMDYFTIHSYVCLFGEQTACRPILKSEYAAKLGLETSLLERVLNTQEYQSHKNCVHLLDVQPSNEYSYRELPYSEKEFSWCDNKEMQNEITLEKVGVSRKKLKISDTEVVEMFENDVLEESLRRKSPGSVEISEER